jgi:hypothetical protein
MADIPGLCDICGRPGTVYTCHLCGRLVCERCYEQRHSLCIECKYHKRRNDTPFHPID